MVAPQAFISYIHVSVYTDFDVAAINADITVNYNSARVPFCMHFNADINVLAMDV